MQYILTEEEYNALKNTQKLEIMKNKNKLQQLCTKIADEMPVKRPWGDKKAEKEPWVCMLTAEKEGHEWYCDHCPVIEICPYEYQEFSK